MARHTGDPTLVEYMMLNLDWSYVIHEIHNAYESRGLYFTDKEEKALTTMMNRGLGQLPKNVQKNTIIDFDKVEL